jgi:transcription termination factor Rho
MSIMDRASLEQSPLADLHAIASELSIDGYRRLRKEELIEAILRRQDGEGTGEGAEERDEAPSRRRRGRRGGRGRSRSQGDEEEDTPRDEDPEPVQADPEAVETSAGERREDEIVEGVIELLPGGSAFVRVAPPEPSDQDVYVSAAQVRRCELVTGDRVSGPRRPPRRSERFPSLIRVDTINGTPASEAVDSTRFADLPAAFPTQPLATGSEDPTLRAVLEAAPIGRGSRVTICGAAQAGKSELLRRLSIALAGEEGLHLWLVLAGVRPEELSEWRAGPVEPTVALALGASSDAQVQAIESVVEQGRRMAARGTDVVVLIDTLEQLPGNVARRILSAARNVAEGGSLTMVATRSSALGGETTVVALDAALAAAGRFPSVAPEASWTMRAELLAAASG